MEMQARRRALLIVDGQYVKIILGTKLKCIPLAEIERQDNTQFLRKLFSGAQVMKVDKVSAVSEEDLVGLVGGVPRQSAQRPAKEARPSPLPPSMVAGPSRNARPRTSRPMPRDMGQWIKSNQPAIILLDDLPVGKISRGGVEMDRCLVLEPGRPVNLESLDKEKVAGSRMLSYLMGTGGIVRISHEEAMAMLEVANNTKPISAHDAETKEVGRASRSESRDMVDRMFEDETDNVAAVIDLNDNGRGSGLANETADSMEALEAQLDQGMPERSSVARGFRRI